MPWHFCQCRAVSSLNSLCVSCYVTLEPLKLSGESRDRPAQGPFLKWSLDRTVGGQLLQPLIRQVNTRIGRTRTRGQRIGSGLIPLSWSHLNTSIIHDLPPKHLTNRFLLSASPSLCKCITYCSYRCAQDCHYARGRGQWLQVQSDFVTDE